MTDPNVRFLENPFRRAAILETVASALADVRASRSSISSA
jgi:hypothetical protein